MPQFETLDTLSALKKNSTGCRVLLRGDLNVPMRNGLVTEATRIERLAPTILEEEQYTLDQIQNRNSLTDCWMAIAAPSTGRISKSSARNIPRSK